VLPNNNKTLTDVLERLNTDNWNSTLNKMHKQDVKVYLPRFKVENKFLLNNVLKDMGMPVAFSDAANFSGISDRKICISEVIHKTYVSVDEDGTEAAAVTSIGFATSSMPTYPIFCVNRPFVFLIRERVTGVILFIGKMAEVHKF
jgi:serpin B